MNLIFQWKVSGRLAIATTYYGPMELDGVQKAGPLLCCLGNPGLLSICQWAVHRPQEQLAAQHAANL